MMKVGTTLMLLAGFPGFVPLYPLGYGVLGPLVF